MDVRSVGMWGAVLVGSSVLGLGLYSMVLQPPDSAAGPQESVSAEPSPKPTVYRYRTKVVKDPPERRVVDVPVAAPANGSTGSGAGTNSYSGSTGRSGTDDDSTAAAPRADDNGGGRDDSGSDDSWADESEGDDDAWEDRAEAAQQAQEQEREAAKQAAEAQAEAAKQAAEDEHEDEDDD